MNKSLAARKSRDTRRHKECRRNQKPSMSRDPVDRKRTKTPCHKDALLQLGTCPVDPPAFLKLPLRLAQTQSGPLFKPSLFQVTWISMEN